MDIADALKLFDPATRALIKQGNPKAVQDFQRYLDERREYPEVLSTKDTKPLYNVGEVLPCRGYFNQGSSKRQRICRIEQVSEQQTPRWMSEPFRVKWWDWQYVVRPHDGGRHATPMFESNIMAPPSLERYFQLPSSIWSI